MDRKFMRGLVVTALTIGVFVSSERIGTSCPFCTAQSQTFTEEMESMDVVVLARLLALPEKSDATTELSQVPKAKFAVKEIVKPSDLVKADQKFEALYYGEAPLGETFLVMGVIEGKNEKHSEVIWSTPVKTSSASRAYLARLATLPKAPERLEFFQDHLEDSEELIARDAYDEFAKASYEWVISLKPKMKHDQLVKWIKDSEIPASRRRLYLTMLGVCGGDADLPMLEEMIRSDDKKAKAGLDALLACYLTLKGEEGVSLVEEQYLKNKKSEYADTYAAIMSLRFHGTETKVIPVKRIVTAMRHMLDRPELADLVIPDLARWEDWESLDRLVELFRKADEKTSWVRDPIVNFVKVCPLPEAKEKMAELEKIDPKSVKRANSFFPFGPPKPPADAPKTSENASPIPSDTETETSAVVPAAAIAESASSKEPKTASLIPGVNQGAARAAAARKKALQPLNLTSTLGVAWLAGAVLFALQWSLLAGGRK